MSPASEEFSGGHSPALGIRRVKFGARRLKDALDRDRSHRLAAVPAVGVLDGVLAQG
jgi:hypothetical protein